MAQALENNNVKLPFGRLFSIPESSKVLDFLFSNYDLRYSSKEISQINNIPDETTDLILRTLLEEKIIKREKEEDDILYFTDVSSPRSEGLFRYVRATLDENLSSHEYEQ